MDEVGNRAGRVSARRGKDRHKTFGETFACNDASRCLAWPSRIVKGPLSSSPLCPFLSVVRVCHEPLAFPFSTFL